ncbi:unnamed protein product, partial [Vitis vinifera]
MAVAGDDTMDFNFETGAKGKTTAFNFSKMDMDFNLDGDFGKISSFKVDMSDLDFSPKKTGKSKERSGEDSVNRNHQGKQDNFAFSFDFNEEDTTIGGKLVGRSSSQTTELAKGEPVFLGSEKNVQDVNPIKDDLDAVRTQSRISKLVSTSRPCVQEVAKGETVLLGSARSVKDLNTFSLQVDPSSSIKQIAKSSTHKCVNPKPVVLSMGPIKNLKTISVEGNKLSGVKDLSRTPKPSSLKISRATGASNILSNSTFGKEIKSLRKSEQNMELQGKTASKMVPSVDTLKKTPPTSSSSLKRKTLEEASEVVFKEQVCNQEKLVDMNTKNVLTSVLDTPREVNMSELEIPLAMENDLNVEKAEAYTKDLEDICNMLKKKHEEAKEILVRAIVNNNNLLMVNHPVYEEKISFQLSLLLYAILPLLTLL